MMPRAHYTACKLFIDGVLILEPSDYLKTPGGSSTSLIAINAIRSKAVSLSTSTAMPALEQSPRSYHPANVHSLHWYSRQQRATLALNGYRQLFHAGRVYRSAGDGTGCVLLVAALIRHWSRRMDSAAHRG